MAVEKNINYTNTLLTVIILAYNHEKYIRKSIESVLRQKTKFKYQILIGEDNSTDNTLSIVKEYESKYPDKVKVIVQDPSKKIFICGKPTGRHNFLSLMKSIKTKYIGLIDGDDYWIDDFKLQKQIDLLEENPDCTLCACNCYYDSEQSGKLYNSPPRLVIVNKKKIYEHDLVAEIVPFHPSTLIYRTSSLDFYDWYETILGVDFGIFFTLIKKGPFIAIEDVCSVYQRNDGSVTKSRKGFEDIVQLEYIKMYSKFDELTDYKYKKQFNKFKANNYYNLVFLKINNDLKNARLYFWHIVKLLKFKAIFDIKILKLFIRLYFPGIISIKKWKTKSL